MRRCDLHDAGFAQTQIGADRGFLLGVDRRPPQYLALRLGAFQPRLDPVADHGALELGEDAHHLEKRLASRGRGVHALLVKVQVNPEGVQLREERHKVLQAAPQAVHRPCDDHIEAATCGILPHGSR